MASVTSRYARAFADVVFDLKLDAKPVVDELHTMMDVVKANPDLRRVWESPAVPQEQKLGLLDAVSGKAGLVTPVRNFLAVVIDHGRISMLTQIASQFERELNRRMGLTDADIVSARELSQQEKLALEKRIERLTGKKVLARYATDPGIMGGAMVKLGSTIYDGSVRGQLQKLKEKLSAE